MSDTIELIDRAEIKDGQAIVAYSRTEAALADLRARYQDARYDLTTTAGDKAARAARLELTTTRTSLEKKRKELKAPAVEFGRKVDAEAARLTGELLALENPIDAQIKADEKRRDDERRAREEAEAARKKVHTDAIAKIAGYVAQAAEMPSARIAAGLAFLEGLELTGFEEFTEEAAATRQRTVAALQALFAKAKAREDEEARLKAEREEQARIAAEQAETARQLKAQQDELARQREALDAEERRQEAERERIRAEEAERLEREAAQRALMEAAAAASAPTAAAALPPAAAPVATPTASSPVAKVVPIQRPTPAPATPPTLTLGQIGKRLGFNLTADFLKSLGFEPAGRERAAVLFHEASWPAMCQALVAHVSKVSGQQRAA